MSHEPKGSDQEFLEYLVKSIVNFPDDVKVERKIDEMGVLLTLSLNAQDMSRVIGRQGQTAKSIRTLLRIVGLKHNARVNLKIEEPEGGRIPREVREDSPAQPQQKKRETSIDDVVEDLKLD